MNNILIIVIVSAFLLVVVYTIYNSTSTGINYKTHVLKSSLKFQGAVLLGGAWVILGVWSTVKISFAANNLIVNALFQVPDFQVDPAFQSDLDSIESTLVQLQQFIERYENFIRQNNINVITDSSGALDISVDNSVSDAVATRWMNMINVLDGLINSHVDTINSLINHLRSVVPNDHIHILDSLVRRLTLLTSRYGHCIC